MVRCVAGNQYMPSVEYFVHWKQHDTLWLEAHEHFQKRTWRNKTAILGPDKAIPLTVPLKKGKHQQMNIQDVQIAYDEPWPKHHLTSIRTAYGKTAFFNEIEPGLEALFGNRPETLWELNLSCLNWLTSMLPGTWATQLSTEFVRLYPPEVRDVRKGVAAGLPFDKHAPLPEYPQIHRLTQSHLPNLCILDVICHLGPGTLPYLTRYSLSLYPETP